MGPLAVAVKVQFLLLCDIKLFRVLTLFFQIPPSSDKRQKQGRKNGRYIFFFCCSYQPCCPFSLFQDQCFFQKPNSHKSNKWFHGDLENVTDILSLTTVTLLSTHRAFFHTQMPLTSTTISLLVVIASNPSLLALPYLYT